MIRIRRRPVKLPIDKEYVITLFTGVESGLATTAGIIGGLVAGTDDRELVAISATIAIMIQAFNSSMSKISAERIENEIENTDHKLGYRKPLIDALAQFFAHVLAGTLVLLPIIIQPGLAQAMFTSIAITLALLFAIGMSRGIIVKRFPWRDAVEMVVTGALVVSVGIIAGLALQS